MGNSSYRTSRSSSTLKEGSDALRRSEEKKSDEIRNKKIEVAIILDSNGKLVSKYSGDKKSVSFSKSEARGNTVIHNHVKDVSFSNEDIHELERAFAKEFIVVTPKNTYRASIDHSRWKLFGGSQRIEIARSKLMDRAIRRIERSETTKEIENSVFQHNLWTEVSNMNVGFSYSKAK